MLSMFYLHINTTVTEFISTEVGALPLTTETSLLNSQSNTTQKDVNQVSLKWIFDNSIYKEILKHSRRERWCSCQGFRRKTCSRKNQNWARAFPSSHCMEKGSLRYERPLRPYFQRILHPCLSLQPSWNWAKSSRLRCWT